MTARKHKFGLDANLPIHTEGPHLGMVHDRLRDAETIAGTGAAWVRLNFVLGPWSGPLDQTRHQGRTWAETYHQIIDQYLAQGLQIYGLVGHEAVKSAVGLPHFFREHRDRTPDRSRAQQWMADYVRNFEQIVTLFHQKVTLYESFNEPDDWHGGRQHWIHPTWFADMLSQIYRRIKREIGIPGVKLISGPLQGLDINFNQSPMHYLRETYEYGKQNFGWASSGYPFDGVGYHLYIEEAFQPDWEEHKRRLRQKYRDYVNGFMGVIRTQEGAATAQRLYISEIGWPSNRNSVEDKARQAEVLKLELELLQHDPAVALGIWFCTEDFNPGEKSYGLYQMNNPGPVGRKPAYFAFKGFCESLNGASAATPPQLDLPVAPTNQNMINAFYRASKALGLGDWGLIKKAGVSLAALAQARAELYTGPALAALSDLSLEEKQKLHAVLAAEVGAPVGTRAVGAATRGLGEAASPTRTFLRRLTELANVPLAPAPALALELNRLSPGRARQVAEIWNRYGWLLLNLADLCGFEPGVAMAVMAIESGGRGFGGDGRMIIRFENHIFHKYWGQHHPDAFPQHFSFDPQRRWQKHQWRPNAQAPWSDFHGTQSREWAAFSFANSLDGRAAKLSISMGAPQIMGFNYTTLGYGSVEEMFEAFSTSERQQILGFFDFVCGPAANPRALIALQGQDFESFAAHYNGPGQAARYGTLLNEAFEAFNQIKPL